MVETLENRWLLSAAGDVDLTLTAGLVGPSDDTVSAVLRQGNQTVVAGESPTTGVDFLARYDASGNLDATFGNAGRVNFSFGGSDIIRALTIDSSGNIVAAGVSSGNMAVARFTANGQLDTSFDGDGLQTIAFAEPAQALSVATNGGVIAVAGTSGPIGSQHFAVAELDGNGQLTSFGAQITAIGDDAGANAVLVDGAGNVYAAGQSTTAGQTDFTIAKYTSGGGLDANFDGPDPLFAPGNGVVVTSFGGISSVKALAFHGAGVLAIGTGAGVAMAQYDALTGAPDATFNAGTPFQANVGGISVTGGGVDGVGRVYATGTVQDSGPISAGALRFLATGAVALDATYGSAGVAQSGVQAAAPGQAFLSLAADGSISAVVNATATPGADDLGTITGTGAAGPTGSTAQTVATDDVANAVYVDGSGATYLAGATTDNAVSQRHGFILKRLASGAVDTTFGNNGVVTVNFGTDIESVTGMAVDASGRLLVAGVTFNGITGAAVARYSASGALDTSFGNAGVVTVVLPAGDSVVSESGIRQVVRVAADGNDVIVAGTTENLIDFFVARYLGADGSADPAFNGGQTAVNDLAQPSSPAGVTIDVVSALAVSGHNIYVGGGTSDDGVDYNAVVVKYTPAGVLDTSFDGDGIVITDLGDPNDAFNGLAIDGSGRVVAAGAAGDAIAVARYDSATGAAVDSTVLAIPAVGGAQGLAIDASGNIVLAATTLDGGSAHHLSAVRLTGSLALDATFGSGGVAQATFAAGASDATSVAIGGDGKITVAGSVSAATLDVAAARFLGAVVVVNQPPVVDPVVGPSSGLWQSQLTFTGTYSDPGDLTVHTQTWVVKNAANQIVFTASGSTLNWTPNAVGTFTVTFTVTDNNGAGLSGSASKNVTVTSAAVVGGVLTVQGNGAGNTITVNRNAAGDYRVLVDGQAAQIFSQASVASLFLTAGDGNDVITIGSGVTVPNEVHGGNGNDVITGGGGGDMLFGEAGNDQIMARGQSDILVGGDGNDYLDGGAGRDVLIGGTGSDTIFGDNGDDILIAANTTHDTDPAALNAIRTAWTGAGTYADRVAALKATLLRPGVDYFDDNVIDLMSGDEGRDWFIANTSGSGVHDLVLSDLFREIVTDI